MNARDEEFLRSLRETFKVEASEHLQMIATGLIELEKSRGVEEKRGFADTIFRAAHSLKGAARAVDFTDVEALCQSLESQFASWRRLETALTSTDLDSAHRMLDEIAAALSTSPAGPRSAASLPPAPSRVSESAPDQSRESFEDNESTSSGWGTPGSPAAGSAQAPVSPPPQAPLPEGRMITSEDTVRINVGKLDIQLLEAEEMLGAKLAASRRAKELRGLERPFGSWKREWAAVESEARALRRKLDQTGGDTNDSPADRGLLHIVEFLEWNREHIRSLEDTVVSLAVSAEQDCHVIGKLVDDLLENSKKLLLLPFGTLAASFPRLVRDLCRAEGKEAELVLRGEGVEIDKRILEEMKDPLIHLLRNCVDHGIEPPEERAKSGKARRATITISASPVNGSKVEITVSDDGAGVDLEKVKASAIRHGFLPAVDAGELSDEDALRLIFRPDVTTSPIITRVSGRGLGMAIVQEKVKKLGGTARIESRRGEGTRFRLVLPSQLATFRGIAVESSGQTFVLPTARVERAIRFRPEEIKTVEGRETLSVGGRAISLVRLAEVLDLPAMSVITRADEAVPALILGQEELAVAFAVDTLLGEEEVLVKALSKPLSRVRNIAGATVLASGAVAPILNAGDLLKTARKAKGAAAARAAETAKPRAAPTILVAEDSITSRMLLKNILESRGYVVKTAVDGMEALTLLREESFDLLVSDVEMPRLNGFDLAARIRADRKLSELPIILVTALEKREDRERGIDAGANAYIVKSSLDQSDLLDAVQRLI